MKIDKISVVLFVWIGICGTMAFALPVLAVDNTATQTVSVTKASAVYIVARDNVTDVSTITFPGGVGGATISNPTNGVDVTAQDKSNASEPVARLNNTDASITYVIWYNVGTFTNNTVTSESYNVTAVATAAGAMNPMSFDSDTNTTTTISASSVKNLWLEVVLNAAGAGKTGTSTISILGEAQ